MAALPLDERRGSATPKRSPKDPRLRRRRAIRRSENMIPTDEKMRSEDENMKFER